MHDPAVNQSDLPCYADAYLELRKAADADTRKQHVFNLELGLGALRQGAFPKVITTGDRDELRINLVAAHEASQRMLSGLLSAEQIKAGYRAASGVLDAWALPPGERRGDGTYSVCRCVLGMFWFDVINMRRADDLVLKLRGASLGAVLPPLPKISPLAPCVVVPFPKSPNGSR